MGAQGSTRKRLFGTGVAGVLAANSMPHLVTAAAGRSMMTPLAGKQSGPLANLLWGSMNLTAGLAIAGRTGRHGRDWSKHLAAFSVGAAAFLAWAAIAEGMLHMNASPAH